MIEGSAKPGTVVFLADPLDAWGRPPGSAALSRAEVRISAAGFDPPVVAVPRGSKLTIRSAGEEDFDVSGWIGFSDSAFRHRFARPDDVFETTVSRPGLWTLEEEHRPRNRGFIYVTPTAAGAVASSDGRFRIDGVAPGRHRLDCWNIQSGLTETEVVVSGEVARADCPASAQGR